MWRGYGLAGVGWREMEPTVNYDETHVWRSMWLECTRMVGVESVSLRARHRTLCISGLTQTRIGAHVLMLESCHSP